MVLTKEKDVIDGWVNQQNKIFTDKNNAATNIHDKILSIIEIEINKKVSW